MISFTSDWLYPSYQSQEIVRVLRRMNGDVAYCDLPSNYGHDAFLVDVAEQTRDRARVPRQHGADGEGGLMAGTAATLHRSQDHAGGSGPISM